MLYSISVNKRNTYVYASSAEMAVRSEMCWYSDDTVFIVSDESGKVFRFKKIKSDNPVIGYTDLIEEVM